MTLENEFLKKAQTTVRARCEMTDPDDPGLSVSRQRQILGVSRSAHYYEPQPEADRDERELLGAILDILGEIPFFGYRKVTLRLKEDGQAVTRKQVKRIMHRARLRALYPGKKKFLSSSLNRLCTVSLKKLDLSC